MNIETIKTFSKVGTPLYMAPEVTNNYNGYVLNMIIGL